MMLFDVMLAEASFWDWLRSTDDSRVKHVGARGRDGRFYRQYFIEAASTDECCAVVKQAMPSYAVVFNPSRDDPSLMAIWVLAGGDGVIREDQPNEPWPVSSVWDWWT